jgi:hypothetical protein
MEEEIIRVLAVHKADGIILYPTDTVWVGDVMLPIKKQKKNLSF